MSNNFLQPGKTIKMEIHVIPSYLSFRGIIEKVEKGIFTVKINGEYAQKEPQAVRCIITNNSKTRACLFETTIKHVINDQITLVIPNEKDMRVVQRREYIRVPVDKEVNCYLIGINGKKIESDKVFPAIVKDISGGGVLLNSPLSLPSGTVLVFEIEIDKNNFLLTIEVLRNLESEENGTRNLGCKFIGIDEGDRQKIIAYCNRQQLILKRRSAI